MVIDILVLAVLLISALIAFLRGFIREVLTIAGVVGGLIAAYVMGPFVTPYMRGWLGLDAAGEGTDAGSEAAAAAAQDPEKLFGILPYDVLAVVLSYGLVFLVVVILLSILSHFLAEGIRSLGLGAVDRTMGFIFGLVRGVILIGLLYLPVYFFVDTETKEEWFETSRTQFYMEKVAQSMAAYIPSSAVEDAEGKIEEINEADKTRRRLEEINVLKSKDGKIEKTRAVVVEEEDDPHGYDEEFREQIDQLFEQQNAPDQAGNP